MAHAVLFAYNADTCKFLKRSAANNIKEKLATVSYLQFCADGFYL